MIVARLHGRLGNQMFQYAAARGLAALHDTTVALDSRLSERRGEGSLLRAFELEVATPDRLPPDRHEQPLAYAFWRYFGSDPRFQREAGLGYNPRFPKFPANSYLHGYWQCERYFSHIADDIRKSYTFHMPQNAQNAAMAARIKACEAISLHVRRGDYLSLGNHICDQSYYAAALEKLRPHVSETPTVFVFSDDPEWVRSHLPLPYEKVVVDINGSKTDYEDMRLMSMCRHNIIANSSFSWWGAWLNTNPQRQVVGPATWFANATQSNPDILPEDWLRVA